MLEAKVIRSGIHITCIVENGATDSRDDRHGGLNRDAGTCIAADRFANVIFWPDIAEVETTEIVGTTEVEPVEDRHFGAVAPGADDPDAAVKREDDVVGKKEVLRRLEIEAIGLDVA